MVETTWSAATRRLPAASATVTATARSSVRCTVVAQVLRVTVPPAERTWSAQRSHIMPGPYLGYWNSSIRLVMSLRLRRGISALITALASDRFLIRWAAQSACSSVAGMPQIFSL
jgi:hypothetical protein